MFLAELPDIFNVALYHELPERTTHLSPASAINRPMILMKAIFSRLGKHLRAMGFLSRYACSPLLIPCIVIAVAETPVLPIEESPLEKRPRLFGFLDRQRLHDERHNIFNALDTAVFNGH
jgi:hypothetical protein